MLILKMIGKIILIPLWVVLVIAGIITRIIVYAITFTKAILGLGLTALIIGTIVCYQDWVQVGFLLCMSAVMFFILFTGVFVEEMLIFAREKVEDLILV